jgi:hypothetical protein
MSLDCWVKILAKNQATSSPSLPRSLQALSQSWTSLVLTGTRQTVQLFETSSMSSI